MNYDYSELVERIDAWEIKNWGTRKKIESGFKYAHQPLLGIVEELGELAKHLTNPAEAYDAIGDVMIFMVDYCLCMSIRFVQLVKKPAYEAPTDFRTIMKTVGYLCHHHLKLEQDIRGNISTHLYSIEAYLTQIIGILKNLCEEYDFSFKEVIFNTWEYVETRDWSKDKEKGGVE